MILLCYVRFFAALVLMRKCCVWFVNVEVTAVPRQSSLWPSFSGTHLMLASQTTATVICPTFCRLKALKQTDDAVSISSEICRFFSFVVFRDFSPLWRPEVSTTVSDVFCQLRDCCCVSTLQFPNVHKIWCHFEAYLYYTTLHFEHKL